jgi:hypothetical protein
MNASLDLPGVVSTALASKNLQPRADLIRDGWRFWELRNLNMHRVVGLVQSTRQYDVASLDVELRGTLARNFKRAWWRGIAYGVVAHVGNLTLTPDELTKLVDARENSRGTMQWVVLLSGETRTVTGVHTWIEGFLSPVYRSILQSLSQKGYTIASAMKDKDGLMKFLTAIGDARTRALFGQPAFPEFRDPFLDRNATRSNQR